MEKQLSRCVWALCGGIVLMVAGGCSPHGPGHGLGGDVTLYEVGPLVGPDGANRSLALDSPTMSQWQAMYPVSNPPLPWYHNRNDRRPGVVWGTQRTIVSVSQTRTRETLRSRHGRVRDDFRRTRESNTVIELVR